MPAKAIPLIVVAVVATAFVIYENREQIVELYERGKEKLAESLHRVADHVSPRQREAPVGYSDYEFTERRRNSFDERSRREEEAEGFLQPYRTSSHRATGRAPRNPPARYRQRNTGGNSQDDQVLGDLPSSGRGENPFEQTHEAEMLPPPLPPRVKSNPEMQNEPTPSESGYGSEHTVFASPPVKPIKPQPSPLAQAPQQIEYIMPTAPPAPPAEPVATAISNPVVPLAAPIIVGAAVGTTAAVVAPEILASVPSSPSTVPHVQSPLSIHSSSDSEPDVIPPNPFESAASYMSTQEWVNNTSSSEVTRPSTPAAASENGSVAGEMVDIPDVVSDFGSASEGDFDDAASWTELGSQTSENDY